MRKKDNMSAAFSILHIDSLRVLVKIGVEELERSTSQEIFFSIVIYYNQIISGAISDKISDTMCYDKICQQIKHIASTKEFCLLEHLVWNVFARLKSLYPEMQSLKVTAHKMPAILDLMGGVHFTIED